MSVEENIKMKQAAETTLCLAIEVAGTNRRFWETIRDHALKFAPLPDEHEKFRPMTDEESKQFGHTLVSFGKHQGCHYDDVPLDYLEWLADRNVEVLRYIKSRRIKKEKES